MAAPDQGLKLSSIQAPDVAAILAAPSPLRAATAAATGGAPSGRCASVSGAVATTPVSDADAGAGAAQADVSLPTPAAANDGCLEGLQGAMPSASPQREADELAEIAEIATARAAAAQARAETQKLWDAVNAVVADATVAGDLQRRTALARALAEAELERQAQAAAWDAVRELVDQKTFATITRKVEGCDNGRALSVGAARRIFDSSSGSAGRRSGSAARIPRGSTGEGPRRSIGSVSAAGLQAAAASLGANQDVKAPSAGPSGPSRTMSQSRASRLRSDARREELQRLAAPLGDALGATFAGVSALRSAPPVKPLRSGSRASFLPRERQSAQGDSSDDQGKLLPFEATATA